MSSLFRKPPKSRVPLIAPPIVPTPDMGEMEDLSKLVKSRSGRQQTIIAGDLEPTDIGKRTLLG
jgi:hypothetical protein